jgi:mRNA interferase YafQ
MLFANRSTQFKRDLKLAEKRGRDVSKIKTIMAKLANEEPLDSKFKDHKLGGDYINHRECHVEPDWLLIYRVKNNDITFVRTGTHSDLFKN